MFFSADDGTRGEELWKSDGSRAGTVLVKNIDPTDYGYRLRGSDPSSLTAVRGRLFFSADDDTHGEELWKSDGSRAGTVLVRDISPEPLVLRERSLLPDRCGTSLVLLRPRRHPRRRAVEVGREQGGHCPGQEHQPGRFRIWLSRQRPSS